MFGAAIYINIENIINKMQDYHIENSSFINIIG